MPIRFSGHGRAAVGNSFWVWLDDVDPALARWPVDEMVRLIDAVDKSPWLRDPALVVEQAMGRRLTVEERGLVMMKVLAPVGTGPPPDALRSTFIRVAELAECWAAAIVAGAGVLSVSGTPTEGRG
jgi:hypothetical protein